MVDSAVNREELDLFPIRPQVSHCSAAPCTWIYTFHTLASWDREDFLLFIVSGKMVKAVDMTRFRPCQLQGRTTFFTLCCKRKPKSK